MSWSKLLVPSGSPVLTEVAATVKPSDDLAFLLPIMEKACKKNAGCGLAAPQVGVGLRVIFAMLKLRGTIRGEFMVNPVITDRSAATVVAKEGCLSYPGIEKYIRRHESVKVLYETVGREVRELELGRLGTLASSSTKSTILMARAWLATRRLLESRNRGRARQTSRLLQRARWQWRPTADPPGVIHADPDSPRNQPQ